MRDYTVGDCFYQIRNGANIKQGGTGGYPITRIETTTNDTFNRDRMGYAGITDLSKYESYVLEDGDLLMSHINSVQYLGRTVLYKKQEDETIIHGMNLLSLKANREIVLPEFACYSFRSDSFKKQLSKITKKSVNQASFTVADLKKITLSVPSLNEQKEIVQTLDKCQLIDAKRKQQLSALDDLIKARFVELFGDIVVNPFGHKEATVAEYCQMTQGTQIPMSEQVSEYQDGYYRYLYIRDLKYDDDEWIYVLDQYDEKKLTSNDLVVVNTGNTAGEIYRGKDGILSNNLFKVSFDQEVLSTTYLFYYFRSETFQNMLWSEMKEGTQPHLGHKIFGSKKLVIPKMELQTQFEAFVNQVDKSKVAIQKALNETQLLFDSLMQQYFG